MEKVAGGLRSSNVNTLRYQPERRRRWQKKKEGRLPDCVVVVWPTQCDATRNDVAFTDSIFSSSFSDWMRAEVLRSSARRRQTRQLITVLRVCVCGGIHPSSHTHNAPSSTHFLDGKKIKSFFKTTLFFGEFKLFFNLFLPANDFRFYKSIDPSTLSAFRFEGRNIVSNCCKLSFLTYVIWLFTFI
jgi:hypothetical protein